MQRTFLVKLLAAGGLVAAAAVGVMAFSSVAGADSSGQPTVSIQATANVQASSICPQPPSSSALNSADPNDAEHWPLWIQGQPCNFEAGGTAGWYFWHNADGMHIRTTTPSDKLHPFEAVLRTDGTFYDIDKVKLEGADDVRLLDGGHVLVVKFHTWDGIDGVDFRTTGDDLHLRFDENGQLIDPSNIFVGLFALHPPTDPFAVHR